MTKSAIDPHAFEPPNKRSIAKLLRRPLPFAYLACLATSVGGCSGGDISSEAQDENIASAEQAICSAPALCEDVLMDWCEGPAWPNGIVYYRITNPTHPDAPQVVNAMRDWEAVSIGTIQYVDATGLGKSNSEIMRLTINNVGSGGACSPGPGSDCSTSVDAAYHELGHGLGLPHEFQRRDRDHYVRLHKTEWMIKFEGCTKLYPRCSDPGGDFGPHEYRSTVGYTVTDPDITRWDGAPLHAGPACGSNTGSQAAPLWFTPACVGCNTISPGALTKNDGAKIVEMYNYGPGSWDKFKRTDDEDTSPVGARSPYPSTITGNVKIVGSPAVDTWEGGSLSIFVRGTDNQIYQKTRASSGASWGSWSVLSNGEFSSDPAVAAWGSGRHDLVAKGLDNQIYIRSFISGSWNFFNSLGAPSVGAASAPAITSWGSGRLDVFVRGTDNKLYWRRCSTTGTNCTPSSGNWNSWQVLSTSGTFRGKPGVVTRGGNSIDVLVHGMDNKLWSIHMSGGTWGSFNQVPLGGTLGWQTGSLSGSCTSDDCYSPAATARSSSIIDVFIRGGDDKVWKATWAPWQGWTGYYPLGGALTSSPALPAKVRSSSRIDLVATQDEERTLDAFVPTLWWKQLPKP